MSFQTELNNILRGTNYSLKLISWNDVSRYNVESNNTSSQGGLSSIGDNITDVKLVGKNNEQFYTIRTDNWNEKVGTVSAREVAIIDETSQGLTPITLSKYLSDKGLSSSLDDKVSIRFQTTFLPISEDDHGTVEFCTDSYSYNTPIDSDPKNLLLLCTTQGLTLHTNKSTYQKLFLHAKDATGKLVNRWLEAEESDYKVGAEQIETDAQVEENMERGKASSGVIGIKSMGQRFNALLTVQIPLKQKERPRRMAYPPSSFADYFEYQHNPTNFFDLNMSVSVQSVQSKSMSMSVPKCIRGGSREVAREEGVSSAARISKGSVASEKATEVDIEKLKRSETEHITITVILYHVVKGGIPTKEDVLSSVKELDQLYSSCMWSGNLKDLSDHNVIPLLVSEKDKKAIKEEMKYVNRTSFPV